MLFDSSSINSAKWWELILPRLFGRKYTTQDEDVRLTFIMWRNGFYITKVEQK